MSSNHIPLQINENPERSEDEIDLRQLAAALLRQKTLIASITVAASVLSGVYAFTLKPVWEGRFQIVLENENNTLGGRLAQLAASNPILSNLAGLDSRASESSLETEVKVLQSPSVLKPIYDFVISTKAAKGEDVSEWIYTDWIKDNLSIKLIKDTSILSLAYQDTDKQIILPVLQRITKHTRNIQTAIMQIQSITLLKFAVTQSKNLREKAKESNRKLDKFKFTYGIGDDVNSINPVQLNNFSLPLSTTSKVTDPLVELAGINKELTRLRQFFTENDPSVQRLQKERQAVLQYIDQTGGGLISIAGGGSKTLNREILLDFKELKRTATRDNAALAAIESELLSLQLQKAQEHQPWELISTPTVLENPVAPVKTRIVALGMIGGLMLGCSLALVRDRRSGLVFSEDELKTILPCPLIENLPAMSNSTWADAADLIAAGPLSKVQETVPSRLSPSAICRKTNFMASAQNSAVLSKDVSLLSALTYVKQVIAPPSFWLLHQGWRLA